jgi:hypothetical protein
MIKLVDILKEIIQNFKGKELMEIFVTILKSLKK